MINAYTWAQGQVGAGRGGDAVGSGVVGFIRLPWLTLLFAS